MNLAPHISSPSKYMLKLLVNLAPVERAWPQRTHVEKRFALRALHRGQVDVLGRGSRAWSLTTNLGRGRALEKAYGSAGAHCDLDWP